MNNLSWFIYLTQIVDNLGTAAAVALVIGGIGGFFGVIFGPMVVDIMDDPPSAATIRSIVKTYTIVVIAACLIAVFTPDRRTMLLIAGSEIGERAVKSQAVNDIVNPGMDLLKTWIKRETDKLTKESSKG